MKRQGATTPETPAAASSSQVAARSFIECATLCTAWKTCRWFDFHQLHQRCCMADRPIDCWGSETSETRSSFDKLTDTCYSTEPCPKQAVVEDSRYCVFMQRVSNSVLFNRTWAEYESGFGNSENWWM
uniref:Fibrinogen C-terminal domain-containing protein n=1 Tax=Macrostomum lignano TaxID=282301 RepID=A0A1I8IWF6_9PLAT